MPLKTQFADTQRSTDPGAALEGTPFEHVPNQDISVADLTAGMVTAIPREQRPPGSGVDIANARIRRGRLLRRPGTLEYGTDGGLEAQPILAIVSAYLEEDKDWLIYMDQFEVYGMTSFPTWVYFHQSAGTTPFPLARPRRPSITQYGPWLYVATVDQAIFKIIPISQNFEPVVQAPIAQFVVSWADRVIAANIKDPAEGLVGTMVAWSGNGNPDVWNPLDDESAGVAVLDSAPSDQGDEITGLHVIGNNLIILRERSIWIARKTGIASAPFRFDPLVTNVGCDLPYTSQTAKDSVIWADRRTETVYILLPDLTIRPISDNISDKILVDMATAKFTDSAYDPFEDEYHLGVNTDGEAVVVPGDYSMYPVQQVWVFSVGHSAWTYDDSPEVTALGQALGRGTAPLIDALTGVIDAQIAVPADALKPNPTGWIDDWQFDGIIPSSIFKGTIDGNILQQTIQATRDWDNTEYELVVESQNLGSFTNRRTLKQLLMTVWAPNGGKLILEFANERQQWIKQKTANMLAFPTVGRTQQVGAPSTQITGNEVRFRLRSKAPVWIEELWVRMLEKSRQRQVKT